MPDPVRALGTMNPPLVSTLPTRPSSPPSRRPTRRAISSGRSSTPRTGTPPFFFSAVALKRKLCPLTTVGLECSEAAPLDGPNAGSDFYAHQDGCITRPSSTHPSTAPLLDALLLPGAQALHHKLSRSSSLAAPLCDAGDLSSGEPTHAAAEASADGATRGTRATEGVSPDGDSPGVASGVARAQVTPPYPPGALPQLWQRRHGRGCGAFG